MLIKDNTLEFEIKFGGTSPETNNIRVVRPASVYDNKLVTTKIDKSSL